MPKSSLPVASVSEQTIAEKIYIIRGQKVMLDRDLAEMYGVETSYLNRAVKRNFTRFPEDFMFQVSKEEFQNLIFQIGISSSWGGTRKFPYAFTEQVVATCSQFGNGRPGEHSNHPVVHKNETTYSGQ